MIVAPRHPALPQFLAVVLTMLLLHPSSATAEDFYRGKVVNLDIGYSPGGGYDQYARMLAKYLGKHLPGDPTIVPSNMAGAGSLRAANYIYSAAARDGTVVGTFSRSIAITPLISSVGFDAQKFTWLGSMNTDVSVCISWNTSPIKTWDNWLTKEFVLGGEGSGSDPDIFALMYRSVFGAKVKLVTGYPGTNDITLAMQRGEVDGLCGISWGTIKSQHPDWIAEKKINIVIQTALKKDPDLPNVPLALDLAKSEEQKQILKLLVSTQALARPFAAPPDLPQDRKDALRGAFDASLSDPELRNDAQKQQLDISPVSGAAVDALLAEIYAIPKDVAAKAAKAIAE